MPNSCRMEVSPLKCSKVYTRPKSGQVGPLIDYCFAPYLEVYGHFWRPQSEHRKRRFAIYIYLTHGFCSKED